MLDVLQLGNRDRFLRTALHAGIAMNAIAHIDRLGLARIYLEDGLWTNIRAVPVAVTLFPVHCHHVHEQKPLRYSVSYKGCAPGTGSRPVTALTACDQPLCRKETRSPPHSPSAFPVVKCPGAFITSLADRQPCRPRPHEVKRFFCSFLRSENTFIRSQSVSEVLRSYRPASPARRDRAHRDTWCSPCPDRAFCQVPSPGS